MENQPFFSIILPTYNRLYSLKEIFLPSLEKQNFLDYELIIIDDGSTDGTDDYFKSDEFDSRFINIKNRLLYIKNIKNSGLPYSRNVGISNSKGEWIFMVEDDIELIENIFLEKANTLINQYKKDYKVISPMIIQDCKGYYDNCFNGFCKIGLLSKEIYLNTKYKNIFKNAKSTHACSFVNKNIYQQYRYSPTTGVSFREESDFYINIQKNNDNKILYLGEQLSMNHKNNITSTGGTRQDGFNIIKKELNYIKYHYVFIKKYFILPEIRIIFFIFVRLIKHISNILRIKYLKKFLALINL